MKYPALVISFLLLSSIYVFAQQFEDFSLSTYWDSYASNYLNTVSAGKGNTGAAEQSDLSGFLTNPASVNINRKYQVIVNYTYKTNQELSSSPDIYLKQQIFSGLAGIGMKIGKKFQCGLVYCNPQGSYLSSDMIRVDEFGNEIGRIDFYIKNIYHSLNAPLVYSTENFRAGINLNYSYRLYTIPGEAITTPEHPIGFEGGNDYKASTSFLSGQAGVIFKPSKTLSLGLSIFSGGSSDVTHTYPDGETTENFFAKHPWEGRAGLQYNIPSTEWRLLVDYSYANTSDIKNLKDMHNFHFGAENKINKQWTARGGFFTLFDNRNYANSNADNDHFFVTGGVSIRGKKYSFNLAILTNMISGDDAGNVLINGGLTLNF